MAITSSGTVSAADFRTEFNGGTGSNLGINSYYRADPYLPLVNSGTISYSDFYNADGRTAEIYTEHSNDGFTPIPPSGRSGWSVTRGSGYVYGGETALNVNAFGSTSRIIPLSTGQNIQAVYAQDQSFSGGSPRISMVLTKRGAGNTATTAGFTAISFRYNNADNQYGVTGNSTINYEETLTRAAATGFSLISDTVVGTESAYAWYWSTSILSGSGIPSIYGAFRASVNSSVARNYISIKIIY